MKKFSDAVMATGLAKTVEQMTVPEIRYGIETTVLLMMAVAYTAGDARMVAVVNDGVVRARYYPQDDDHSHYLQWEGEEKDWDLIVADIESGALSGGADDATDEDGDVVAEATPLAPPADFGG